MLAKKEYDRFGAHLCYSVYKALAIEMTGKWNTHTQIHKAKPAAEYEDVTAVGN